MSDSGNAKEIQSQARGFMNPETVKEGMDLAQWIAKSDLAPKDFKDKPQNVLIAMQMGLEVGLSPMQAIQNIAGINGRPSVWGDSVLALYQNHKDLESIMRMNRPLRKVFALSSEGVWRRSGGNFRWR